MMDASQILKNLKSILVWHIKYFNALSLDEGKEPEPISNVLLMILPRDRDLESVSEGVKVKKPLHTYVKFISALSLSINYFCFLQSLNVVQRRISSTKIAFYIIFKFHQQCEKNFNFNSKSFIFDRGEIISPIYIHYPDYPGLTTTGIEV